MKEREVLALADEGELKYLLPYDFLDRYMSEAEFDHIFKLANAIWRHSGNPAHPHAELVTGRCSNGYIDVLRVLKWTNLCQIFAEQMAKKIREVYRGPIDWVIGSDHAGAVFSHSVAIYLRAQHDFTEKGPNKIQIWRRFTIRPGEVVLQAEEITTDGFTLRAVREGIMAGNPNEVVFAPVAAVLTYRPNVGAELSGIEDSSIVYFRHYDMRTWNTDECPLCAAGSERLRPKQNWAALTAP